MPHKLKPEFHQGDDYAVVMFADETTDTASIRLHCRSREANKFYGELIVAAIVHAAKIN